MAVARAFLREDRRDHFGTSWSFLELPPTRAGRAFPATMAKTMALLELQQTGAHCMTMMRTTTPLLALLLLLGSFIGSLAFGVVRNPTRVRDVLQAKIDDETDRDTLNPITKSVWFGVEAFGKVFGDKTKVDSQTDIDISKPPQSMQETFERIKDDNDRSYFLSGKVDKLIYDPDCVFADPFVSFSGRDRFVDNLQNLGSFITKYSAKMLDYSQDENTVKTKVMVKLELNLPWKPVLAWPWGVSYEIDPETNLITNHVEEWDIDPWEGTKQIFRKPTTQVKE